MKNALFLILLSFCFLTVSNSSPAIKRLNYLLLNPVRGLNSAALKGMLYEAKRKPLHYLKQGRSTLVVSSDWIVDNISLHRNLLGGVDHIRFSRNGAFEIQFQGRKQIGDRVFRLESPKFGVSRTLDHQSRQQVSPETALSPEEDSLPPQVRRVILVREGSLNNLRTENLGVPVKRESVFFEVEFSESMKSAPALELRGSNGTNEGYFQKFMTPQIIRYMVPMHLGEEANGSMDLHLFSKTVGNTVIGTDLAGNELLPYESKNRVIYDTIAPRLRKISESDPPIFQADPYPNQKLGAKNLPRTYRLFVKDYGPGESEQVKTSGFDYDLVDQPGGVVVSIKSPSGKTFPGILATQPPSLVFLTPDLYDPSSGVFEDSNQDGIAEAEEGYYLVRYTFFDKAGNRTDGQYQFFVDTTPPVVSNLRFEFQPEFEKIEGDDGIYLNALKSVKVLSKSSGWDVQKSNAKLFSRLHGPGTIPDLMRTDQSKGNDFIRLLINEDQNGDGKKDWPNPDKGQYVPPGQEDPRFGKNDGEYFVEVNAFDSQGNQSILTEHFVVDTTLPKLKMSFPAAGVTTAVTPPLRILEIRLEDPTPTSGNSASGIARINSQLQLFYIGENGNLNERVRSILYYHKPNPDNPDLPDYNPIDTDHRLLIEFVDQQGRPIPLQKSGLYQARFFFQDKAGNSHQGEFQFRYDENKGEFEMSEVRVVS